ncbi:MAG: hypothetical protein LIO56_04880 [Lachnospiraceae bacterium]|nr:hypothetical protein [Lachnospiraceae bacterium]
MALTQQDLQSVSDLLNPLETHIQSLQKDVLDMRQDMTDMRQDMTDMRQDITDMRQDIQGLSQRISSVEMHLENETDRNIQLLAENHLDLVDKLNTAVDAHRKDLIFEVQISDLQSRMRRLEEART